MVDDVHIALTNDEALVLSDFLSRYEQTDKLAFQHPAEYLALMKVSGQLDKALVELFSSDYSKLIAAARNRLAEGFEGEVPGLGTER